MDKEQKKYLQSLLIWAKEVEEKVASTHMSEQNEQKWREQMKKWKRKIEIAMNQDNVAEVEIQQIQEEGQNLLYTLKGYYDQERQGKRVPIGKHRLPPLPYPYDGLEPYISKEIMLLHHDVHHQAYVDGLNKAEKKLAQLRSTANQEQLKHWLREQSFHGSGHFLHTNFWFNMKPNGGGKPKGELMKQITKDFGSYEQFKYQFTEAAKSVEGDGWALLVWELRSGRLAIQTAEKHQLFGLWDVIPLLVLDVWEHAYYLQYKTKRGEYVENWWNVVNWSDVEKKFDTIRPITWAKF
ncbi:superoxide dismutase [Pontibacillus litoralis]|uniref:superoxide dismutase n=1 Tax=Pontibacillus litoralis JSM 072002 TaxID=1385512 RepID=A0A0A5G4A8_9BACI|nr:superoxide dismutase [Pontibacillus litoralis JSM 072002]